MKMVAGDSYTTEPFKECQRQNQCWKAVSDRFGRVGKSFQDKGKLGKNAQVAIRKNQDNIYNKHLFSIVEMR